MPEYFVPLALVLSIAFLIPRRWLANSNWRPAAVFLLMGMSALFVGQYLVWRLTTTMPEPDMGMGQMAFSWFLLIVELAIWTDTFVFFLTLSRSRDNSKPS